MLENTGVFRMFQKVKRKQFLRANIHKGIPKWDTFMVLYDNTLGYDYFIRIKYEKNL